MSKNRCNRYFAVSDPCPTTPASQYLGSNTDTAMKKWRELSSSRTIFFDLADRHHLKDYLQVDFSAWIDGEKMDPLAFWRDLFVKSEGKRKRGLPHEHPGPNWKLWAFPLSAYVGTEFEFNSTDVYMRQFFDVPQLAGPELFADYRCVIETENP